MIDEDQITNWFSYHAPTQDQVVTYETIRNHAREFAHILNNLVPDSADKSAAMRLLRECVMTANAAVATTPALPNVLVRGHLPQPQRAQAARSPYQTVDTGRPEASSPVRGPNGRFAPKKAPQPVTMRDLVGQLRGERGF